MPDAKIQIKVGSIEFSGEGGDKWLADQLDKLLSKASELATAAAKGSGGGGGGSGGGKGNTETGTNPEIANQTLPAFLKSVDATKAVTKFLATAVWLEAQGNDLLTTREVSQALSDAKQKPLNNPAQALAGNVGSGYCQKKGKKFYITEDGQKSLVKTGS
jgi:hypothetical protein